MSKKSQIKEIEAIIDRWADDDELSSLRAMNDIVATFKKELHDRDKEFDKLVFCKIA